MPFQDYKPFILFEEIHQTISTSIYKYFNNIEVEKVNDYAFLVVQKSSLKLEKVYLYCLLNEFTEEVYLGFTRNIKKTLQQRTDIFKSLGREGEVVLHSLFVLHIESRYIKNLSIIKKTIEKRFTNKRFSVLNKESGVPRKEEIIDELIDQIAYYESEQEELALQSDVLGWFGKENYHNYSKRIEELEKEKEKSMKKLVEFDISDFS